MVFRLCSFVCIVGFIVMPLSSMQSREYQLDNVRIVLCVGDITVQPVDAIVNAANDHMLGGSGVDGAIHTAAGPELLAYNRTRLPVIRRESRVDIRCPMGQVCVTPSFNLARAGIRSIIHTNGPHGDTPNRKGFLAQCYRNSLEAANNLRIPGAPDDQKQGVIRSLAFPAISVGVFGYPLQEATDIAVRAVLDFIREKRCSGNLQLNHVRFVLWDRDQGRLQQLFGFYRQALERHLGSRQQSMLPAEGRQSNLPVMGQTPLKKQGLFTRFARYMSALTWSGMLRQVLSPVFWGVKQVAVATRVIVRWLYH